MTGIKIEVLRRYIKICSDRALRYELQSISNETEDKESDCYLVGVWSGKYILANQILKRMVGNDQH